MEAKGKCRLTRGRGHHWGVDLVSALRYSTLLLLLSIVSPLPSAAQPKGIEAVPLGNKNIRMGFDSFSDTEAINITAKLMLERLGYTVAVQTYEVGVLYAAVAEGKLDVFSGGYLPANHKDYWAKFGDRLEKVGPFHKEFQAGLAVPAYVTDVNSVPDLVGKEAGFGGKVIGNSPGTGNMRQAAAQIKAYGLKMELIESSEAAQTATMVKAIGNKERIVFASWKPQWWWGKWQLKLLGDPKEVVGKADWVWHLLRMGLKTDSPRAYAFYERYHMSADQQGYLMLQVVDGKNAEDASKKFMEDNPGLVREWLGQ